MTSPRSLRARDRQRGNSLLLALIVLSALATLGSLTVVSVQSSLTSSTMDRAQTIAMYAAESGGVLAMDFLRNHFDNVAGWSALVTPANAGAAPLSAALLPSNGALPGTPGNPFSSDQRAWFSATILNNRDDPSFHEPANCDRDARVIIRVTGNGPQGSLAIIEWEVQGVNFPAGFTLPPPGPPTPPSADWTGLPRPGLVLVSWHVVSL